MNQVSDKIDWTISSLGFVIPEIALTLGILALIVAGLISKKTQVARLLSLIILTAEFISLLISSPTGNSVNLFVGMLQADDFNFYLRYLISLSGIFIVILSDTNSIRKNPFEYFTLILTVVLGAQLLVMSRHFVMIVLSLELMSIPSYVLAGFAFDKKSAEATMKYFIYGSIATAFLIFGASWIYGLSHALNFFSPAFAEKLKFYDNVLFLAGGLMVIAGLLFKMTSAPFHFWAPDVYESAPLPVLALFSTIPKVAAASLLIKITYAFGLSGSSRYDWQSIMASISILTLTVGNFAALWQRNVKRLMAYSSIGQAGFLLVASATLSASGTQFFLFYAIVLVVSTVLAFLVLRYFQLHYKAEELTNFSGLGRKHAGMAILLTLAMISLTGLPVTAGFTAKLFIFTGLLEAWSATGKNILLWLFVFGLINTAVSIYYYLKVPYFLFLKESASVQKRDDKAVVPILFGSVLAFLLLWLFFRPDSLMGWINKITFAAQ
jgi:NADH-quinone oxidoreductase subunit N